jgi:hypothetical protein
LPLELELPTPDEDEPPRLPPELELPTPDEDEPSPPLSSFDEQERMNAIAITRIGSLIEAILFINELLMFLCFLKQGIKNKMPRSIIAFANNSFGFTIVGGGGGVMLSVKTVG